MISPHSVSGGKVHGMHSLSPAELNAAQSALSKVLSSSGRATSGLGNLSLSATQSGGSTVNTSPAKTIQIQGSGSDTFVGGARTAVAPSIGNDTVISGSASSFDGNDGILGTRGIASFSLNSDTIHAAGATVLSIKSAQPEESAKAHTVTLGDKTTVTITGLSTHDISKLSH